MTNQSHISEDEREALEYVRDIKGFYGHLVCYLIAVLVMAATNYFYHPEHLWFLWATIGWGFGVLSHGLMVFEVFSFFSAKWEKEQVRKFLEGRRRY